jgi:EAL and modified HD-GYP domain-containing signal transduction protein
MAEILAHLPLDDVVRDALLGQPSPAGQWLFLASAWERGEWGQVAGLLARLGVAPEQAALLYAESLAWAQAVLGASTGGSPARCS